MVTSAKPGRSLWKLASQGEIETAFVRAGVGYFLLIQGDVEAALPELEAVLSLARRAGDQSWLATSAPVFAWARLRQGDVAGARELAEQCPGTDFAVPFPFPEMARAVLAWVAWKDGRFAEVERLARDVLSPKPDGEPPFPFGWICLWPLVAVRLAQGRTEAAMNAARELLQPPQMRLAPELEEALLGALSAWEGGEVAGSAERLQASVLLAERLNYA